MLPRVGVLPAASLPRTWPVDALATMGHGQSQDLSRCV